MPKIDAEVFANIAAPIKTTTKISVLTIEQYRNRCHLPSTKNPSDASGKRYPPGPKFCIKPSTQPVIAKPQPTTFARKKSVPIAPPTVGIRMT
jgi:hypothetical protein